MTFMSTLRGKPFDLGCVGVTWYSLKSCTWEVLLDKCVCIMFFSLCNITVCWLTELCMTFFGSDDGVHEYFGV